MRLINNIISQWKYLKKQFLEDKPKTNHVIKLHAKEKLISKVLVTQSVAIV